MPFILKNNMEVEKYVSRWNNFSFNIKCVILFKFPVHLFSSRKLVTTKMYTNSESLIAIIVGGEEIEVVRKSKYLGVVIEYQLNVIKTNSFKIHICTEFQSK